MVNFVVTTVTKQGSTMAGVAAELETAMEAVVNTDTIFLVSIQLNPNNGTFEGVLMHGT